MSVPPIALPSSGSISASRVSRCSCRSEPLGPDPGGLVTEADELARRGLDEGRRAADVDESALVRGPRDLAEQLPVDPPSVSAPPVRLRAGEREADVGPVLLREPHQPVTV